MTMIDETINKIIIQRDVALEENKRLQNKLNEYKQRCFELEAMLEQYASSLSRRVDRIEVELDSLR
jgi:hypothetical protein